MTSGGEVNVVFFMEEMQKYDCLYNKYSKSYKDKYIKINCWTKIGEKFDMSAADAEKKFEMSSHRPTVSNMNPVEVDSDEDDDNSVSEQGETNKKNKNSATTAIISKHRIATIAQNKNFVPNTFFDDSSDSSDGSDYMETSLYNTLGHLRGNRRPINHQSECSK